MEHESFENDDVAAVLNEHFVSIKVDREERPDVDRVYMTFVQATTGSGGWPMSVWLTPDLKPFFGGTYFPPTSRWGRPGFVDILQEIARVWKGERAKVVQSAEALTAQLRQVAQAAAPTGPPGADALARAVTQFREAFDPRHGGFGGAPKFPRPSELLFLLPRARPRGRARWRRCRARDGRCATLRGDGARRHARSHRRRVPSLLGRRGVARAALREDALRPGAARAGLSRSAPRHPAIRSTRRSPKTRCSTSCAR